MCAGIDLTKENGLWIRIAFDRGVTLPDGREVSIRIDSITMSGATDNYGKTYDVGSDTDKIEFVDGAYEPERSGGRTYRWFEPTFTLQFPTHTYWDFHSGITAEADTSAYDDDVVLTRCSDDFDRQRVSPKSWHEVYFGFIRFGPAKPRTPNN
ncbi:hypothetical protein [Halobaculum sp. MBLA0143]|uniref:hypothetical protein n=1 Tax=Halobaculum sp. MBLA0143 TaxID=3079933 RepID=UPI00352392EA